MDSKTLYAKGSAPPIGTFYHDHRRSVTKCPKVKYAELSNVDMTKGDRTNAVLALVLIATVTVMCSIPAWLLHG